MPRAASIRQANLYSCLANLPLSLYTPLIDKGVAPQTVIVELSWKSRKVVLGWSGLPARLQNSSRHAGDHVEVDAQYAKELGLLEGQQVSIELRQSLPIAKQVNITPASADDWEILELHAAFVEENMLSQVRAVQVDQMICVWVGKAHTFLRFKLDSLNLDLPVARLSTNTEVIIAPRLRAPVPVKPVEGSANEFANTLFRLLPHGMAETIFLHQELSESVIYAHPVLYRRLVLSFPQKCCAVDLEQRRLPDAQSKTARRRCRKARIASSALVPMHHLAVTDTVRTSLGIEEDRLESGFELVKLSDIMASLSVNANAPSHPSAAEQSDASQSSPQSRLKSGRKQITNSPVKHSPPSVLELDCQRRLKSYSPRSLPVLAGSSDILNSALASVRTSFLTRQRGQSGLGILVTGIQGSGKTSNLVKLAELAKSDISALASIQYHDCATLSEERPQTFKDMIKEWFDEACWRSPTCIIADNIDAMLCAEQEHIDSFRVLQLANLFVSAYQEAARQRPVILIASAKSESAYHHLLRSSHIFGYRITLRPPNKEARKDMIQLFLTEKGQTTLADAHHIDYAKLSTDTEGYLPADLRDLVDRAVIASVKGDHQLRRVSTAHFEEAQKNYVPLALRDAKLQTSSVRWSDIGGLHETRHALRETLEWPAKYGAIFAQSPLRLRSGLLLYGFPGCGKTLLASAVAKECGLNFISIKGPELLNKYIGASEQSVRDLFDRAQAAKPCVLFFDEFDSIAPRRGHDSTGVTDRVVNQMLTQMDGAEGLEGVYVLAATSRPDLIDPALLRPGRLDKSLLCDMPSSSDRLEILQACSQKVQLDPSIELQNYVEETRNFSGADLQALIYNAQLEAIHDFMLDEPQTSQTIGPESTIKFRTSDTGASKTAAEDRADQARLERMLSKQKIVAKPSAVPSGSQSKVIVTEDHLSRALSLTRPSVPSAELVRLRRIYDDFVQKRSTNGLESGEASSEIGGRVSLM